MSGIRLTKDDHAELLEAERKLLEMLPEYDKAEACGIDCQNMRHDNTAALNQIRAIKTHYAPLD